MEAQPVNQSVIGMSCIYLFNQGSFNGWPGRKKAKPRSRGGRQAG